MHTFKRIISVPMLIVMLYSMWAKLADTLSDLDEGNLIALLLVVAFCALAMLVWRVLNQL